MGLSEELGAVLDRPPRSPQTLVRGAGDRDQLVRQYSEYGLDLKFHGQDDLAERLAALGNFVRFAADTASPNAVYVDTTTVHTAVALLQGHDGQDPSHFVTPNTLLDLDTFVRAVVLYDNVFHLENPYIDSLAVNEALGNQPVLIALPVPAAERESTDGVAGALLDLYDATLRILFSFRDVKPGTAAHDDMAAIQDAWAPVVGFKPTVQQLIDQEAKDEHWESVGPDLLASLIERGSNELSAKFGLSSWSRFITEHNIRSLFNTRVADLVGLPYAPNSARLPFHLHLARNARVANERIGDLLEIQQALREQALPYVKPTTMTLRLPVLLTVALERTTQLDQFYEVVADLRLSAQSYRAHRRELLQELRNGNVKAIETLRTAVGQDTDAWRKNFNPASLVVSTIEVFSAPLVGLAGWILPMIQLAAGMGELPDDTKAVFARRLLRPNEWFLTDVGTTARKLVNAFDRVQQLWDLSSGDLEYFATRFEQLEKLRG